jgi:hypothetical protein
MTRPLKIYVGYDSREDIAWQVCRRSILNHAPEGVSVHPLRLSALQELGIYIRSVDARATTEFSISRFLTPWLAGPGGHAIFVDCDFLFTADVRTIMDGLDTTRAVHVVQHDYTPANAIKMDGKEQTTYPRKNWSSFILFNCDHPAVQALTPDVVNAASPAWLHRFQWLADDQIGALDLTWNFLEGEYPKPAQTPACIHYTNGGPWFADWQDVDYADLWIAERDAWLAGQAS